MVNKLKLYRVGFSLKIILQEKYFSKNILQERQHDQKHYGVPSTTRNISFNFSFWLEVIDNNSGVLSANQSNLKWIQKSKLQRSNIFFTEKVMVGKIKASSFLIKISYEGFSHMKNSAQIMKKTYCASKLLKFCKMLFSN